MEINLAKIGQRAPDFILTNERGDTWRLSDQIGKVAVLLFYPQNETLVCTRQMCSVRDNWHRYLETKATVVGVSPGTPEQHLAFANRHRLPLNLLADPQRSITRIFGKHWLYPIQFTRAVVVVDAHGIVRTREIMLRAFRPSDSQVITDIYAARGDALHETYDALRERISKVISE